MRNKSAEIKFENDYIYRSNRSITSVPDIAITEFVANAWDAGAHNVNITIPNEENKEIVIEDDGIGMSDEEFHERWMTLNYNRQKRQGAEVIFPDDVEKSVRIAYGRNGVGRHGLLCFANTYTVETWKNGCCNVYDIAITHGGSPFKIIKHKKENKQGHGTKIYTFVNRHLPDAKAMTDILSARFLYDPCFCVKINGKQIDLSQHKGVIYQKDFNGDTHAKFSMIVIDSEKTAAKSQQHGVAFWVSGRLVGQPSWSYGKIAFLDGRLKAAKRYTIIIKTDDLIDDVLPDWSGFIESPNMISVYKCVKQEVDTFIKLVMAEHLNEIRIDAIKNASDELGSLTISGKRNVSAFIEKVTEDNPVINPDYLHTAIEALVSIEKAKRGEELLSQLGQMSQDQIDKLSEILSNWNVDDIATIISEIDKRILVIEAMQEYIMTKTQKSYILFIH